MTIKPDKSMIFAWCFSLLVFVIAIALYAAGIIGSLQMAFGVFVGLLAMIVFFRFAFFGYELTNKGITRRCILLKARAFSWDAFKYIGIQNQDSVRGLSEPLLICSTVGLPKNMTQKEFQKKSHWPLSTTIVVALPGKGSDELYRKFLTFCGGERDIRE